MRVIQILAVIGFIILLFGGILIGATKDYKQDNNSKTKDLK